MLLKKITRNGLKLSELECEIVPNAGIKNQTADATTRLLGSGTAKLELVQEIPVMKIVTNLFNTDDIKQEKEAWKNYKKRLNKSLIRTFLIVRAS